MARTGRKPYETTDVMPFGANSRRLQPPDCLGELQKRAFVDLVCSVPRSQFRASDLPLLCRYAEIVVMAETAAFHLGADGMVTADEEGFEEAGLTAAYSQQVKNLHLRPWQSPPCWIDPADVEDIIAAGPGEDDTHGRYDAARLLKRMLAAGLSRFEPDPAGALLRVPPAAA